MTKRILTESAVTLRALNLGKNAVDAGLLPGQKIDAWIDGEETAVCSGTLTQAGVLSGMALLLRKLGLEAGTEYSFQVKDPTAVQIARSSLLPPPPPVTEDSYVPVFKRHGFNHIHIEPFRAENLSNWEPQTETDIYMAFGVLQEYTDFIYCCGASKAKLDELGANIEPKPDAILIDRLSNSYVIAEWKMTSKAFRSNHEAEDIDVLVCWIDDEEDRDVLPHRVVALHQVAETVAAAMFGSTD